MEINARIIGPTVHPVKGVVTKRNAKKKNDAKWNTNPA